MADAGHIRDRFERNAKVVRLRPARGRYTSAARVRVRDGLTCDIEEGRWKLVADLGPDSGGEGLGPSPGVYGRAALGSCLAMAVVQWAARHELALDGVEVDVHTDADASGAYGVTDAPAGYTQVRCTVTVTSDGPEERIREVVDIATRRCLYWDVFERALDMRRDVRVVRPEG